MIFMIDIALGNILCKLVIRLEQFDLLGCN